MHRILPVILGFLFICNAGVAPAQGVPAPLGPVVLTVSGRIDHANAAGGAAVFDRALLEALGTAEVRTSTPWTDGVKVFRGVSGRVLLDAVGARGTRLVAIALNDYRVEIPITDFRNYDVLLAYEMDGVRLTPRDKGPLWIIYPRDRHPELATGAGNERWIWQLRAIEVRD